MQIAVAVVPVVGRLERRVRVDDVERRSGRRDDVVVAGRGSLERRPAVAG